MKNERILITLRVNENSLIILTFEDGKGKVDTLTGIYHFDQADKINDIVSDLSLLLIPQALGNILFTVIEDWLEV